MRIDLHLEKIAHKYKYENSLLWNKLDVVHWTDTETAEWLECAIADLGIPQHDRDVLNGSFSTMNGYDLLKMTKTDFKVSNHHHGQRLFDHLQRCSSKGKPSYQKIRDNRAIYADVNIPVGPYYNDNTIPSTLKMLGLYLYTLIIGHKSCNMFKYTK